MTDKALEPVELLPCPFCGGEVERVFPPCSDLSEYIRHRSSWDNPASSCPVEFAAFLIGGGDDMVRAWNTRAALEAMRPEGWQVNDFFGKHFFVATVSEDGKEIGLDHPTEADWHKVRQAHIALRDRLNERLAEEDRCPIKPTHPETSND